MGVCCAEASYGELRAEADAVYSDPALFMVTGEEGDSRIGLAISSIDPCEAFVLFFLLPNKFGKPGMSG